jgi:hypothetical protein
VIVRVRQFRLLLGNLIRLCHLSRGQSYAFQGRLCMPARLAHGAERAVYASYLLYESSLWGVKPRTLALLFSAGTSCKK